jgi:two-component system response regulator NreC
VSTSTACILVVDDNPVACEAVSTALERRGLRVVRCATSEAARQAAFAALPQVIVVDLELGAARGDLLGQELRQTMEPRPRVVLFSAVAPDQVVSAARSAGLDAAVPKSAGVTELVDRVLALLDG